MTTTIPSEILLPEAAQRVREGLGIRMLDKNPILQRSWLHAVQHVVYQTDEGQSQYAVWDDAYTKYMPQLQQSVSSHTHHQSPPDSAVLTAMWLFKASLKHLPDAQSEIQRILSGDDSTGRQIPFPPGTSLAHIIPIEHNPFIWNDAFNLVIVPSGVDINPVSTILKTLHDELLAQTMSDR